LLNEVGLSLFRYFEVGLRVCDMVVKKFTFAISSPDEFLYVLEINALQNGYKLYEFTLTMSSIVAMVFAVRNDMADDFL